MNSILKKAGLGVAMAATALTVAAPAEAQYYRHRDRGDATGAAIVGGIIGLGIGAAIARRLRSGSAMAMPATSVINRSSGCRRGARWTSSGSARPSRTRR